MLLPYGTQAIKTLSTHTEFPKQANRQLPPAQPFDGGGGDDCNLCKYTYIRFQRQRTYLLACLHGRRQFRKHCYSTFYPRLYALFHQQRIGFLQNRLHIALPSQLDGDGLKRVVRFGTDERIIRKAVIQKRFCGLEAFR